MKRRSPDGPAEVGDKPPEWVTASLPGLVKFNGDYAALGQARAQWCADNGCRWSVPCSPSARERCVGSGSPRSGRPAGSTRERSASQRESYRQEIN